MPRKPKATEGHETNEAFVARLMTRMQSGPIAQLFVIEAVRKYAEACAKAEPKQMDTGIISGAHWKRCAVEIDAAVTAHLGE